MREEQEERKIKTLTALKGIVQHFGKCAYLPESLWTYVWVGFQGSGQGAYESVRGQIHQLLELEVKTHQLHKSSKRLSPPCRKLHVCDASFRKLRSSVQQINNRFSKYFTNMKITLKPLSHWPKKNLMQTRYESAFDGSGKGSLKTPACKRPGLKSAPIGMRWNWDTMTFSATCA